MLAVEALLDRVKRQEVVTAGLVRRNGEVELRKRAKIISGDIIEFEDYKITIE